MMKKFVLFSFLMLVTLTSFSQLATITGTIVDPNGQIWANAVVRADFQFAPGKTPPFNWSGGFYNTTVQTTTDGSGAFNIQLVPNIQIVPAGTTWIFTICPNVTVQCAIVQLPIIGNGDISSNINSQIAVPVISVATMPRAYSDAEIKTIPSQGGTYYNVTNQQPRYFDGSAFHYFSGTNLGTWTAANQTFISTSPTVGAWVNIPSCNNSTSALQFNISSNLFTCGNSINLAGGVLGSIPYQSAPNTTTYLAPNTTTTRCFLSEAGNGSTGLMPYCLPILAVDIPPGSNNYVQTAPSNIQIVQQGAHPIQVVGTPSGTGIGNVPSTIFSSGTTIDSPPNGNTQAQVLISAPTGGQDLLDLHATSTTPSLAFSGEYDPGGGAFRHWFGRVQFDPLGTGQTRFRITADVLSNLILHPIVLDWVQGAFTLYDNLVVPSVTVGNGFTGVKIAGACTITIVSGIITNVTGC